jgi:hypothetical protein
VFVNSQIGDHIRPQGWLEWAGTENHLTAYYAEGNNTGPGADLANRVAWSNTLAQSDIDALTLENIFARESADPDFAADWTPEVRSVANDPGMAPALPTAFALRPAYPNPFRGRAAIEFDLPDEAQATLTLYDTLGRLVLVLVDERLPAGTHTASVAADALPTGVYFVRLHADAFRQTQKVLVVR